jgi:predicted transcriptional regulator
MTEENKDKQYLKVLEAYTRDVGRGTYVRAYLRQNYIADILRMFQPSLKLTYFFIPSCPTLLPFFLMNESPVFIETLLLVSAMYCISRQTLGLDRYGVTTGSQRQYLYLQSPEDRLGVLLMKYTDRNEIIAQILDSANVNRVRLAKIMYDVYLSHGLTKEYVGLLIEKGFMEYLEGERPDKGMNFLGIHNRVQELSPLSIKLQSNGR